jgi:hypothetical protein
VEAMLWAVTLILGVPSALLIPLNWLMFVSWAVESARGKRTGNFSFCPPFICGVAGAVACLVCPWPGVSWWAWVPPLIDPSIALLFAAFVLHVVARIGRLRSPFDGKPPLPEEQPPA